jgi:CheY-like chemotaxis protein
VQYLWPSTTGLAGAQVVTKPRVLAAFTRHVFPYLEKTVGHYVDVISVRTVEEALERLREDRSIVLVLCGVFFNGSRMFELLRDVRQLNPKLPFIACRILPIDLPQVSIEALTIALETLDARYIDVPLLEGKYGREQAEAEFRSIVLSRMSR